MSSQTKFLALDLELNQPSRRIIEVGVAIGSSAQAESSWIAKSWLLDPHEALSPTISSLTGITESEIQSHAVSWSCMVADLRSLLDEHKPFVNPVTWGANDSVELLTAIRAHGLEFPYFGRRSLDVKTIQTFLKLTQGKSPSGGLRSALGANKLQFSGQPHRAAADAWNTLKLFFCLQDRMVRYEAVVSLAKGIG